MHIHCNDSFLNFIRKTREEVVGKSDFEVYTYENAVQFRQDDKDLIQSKKSR